MFRMDVPYSRQKPVPAVARRLLALAALSAAVVSCGSPAVLEAGLVLQSSTSTLQFFQGSTGSLDLVIDNTGSSATFVNAFGVGVQLVADAGATGTLSLTTVGTPLTASLLSDDPVFSAQPSTLSAATTAGGTDYIQLFGANNSSFEDSLSTAAVANLIAITFTATGDALGTWTLYGVNQSGSSVSYVANYNGDQTDFTNLPTVDDTSVALATITIVAAPVPEIDPGTGASALSLVAAALGVAEGRVLRRSRRCPREGLTDRASG